MMNRILLCEVAKLHQRDLENELAVRQIANQAKPQKIAKIGPIKRYVMVSFASTKNSSKAKAGEAFTG